MDSKTIESLAVGKVSNRILRCEYLVPYLNENDRTPELDGSVYVYKNKDHLNKHIHDKVDVQIKGTKVEHLDYEKINFPVKLISLANFRQFGGTIFFVVQLKNYDESSIYFRVFLPFDISKLQKEFGEQQTREIEFSKLPNDPDEITNIFYNFCADRISQYKYVRTDPITFDEFKNRYGDPTEVKFFLSGKYKNRDEQLRYLSRNPTYLYVKTSDLGDFLPIDRTEYSIITETIKGRISIAQNEYYKKYKLIYEKKGKYIAIGDCLYYHFIDDVIEIKITGNLEQRINSLSFIIAFLNYGKVYINESPIILGPVDSIKADIADYKKQQSYLMRIRTLLVLLECDTNIDLQSIPDNEIGWMNLLITGLIDKKAVKINIPKVTPILIIKIFKKKIYIWVEPTDDGSFVISKYFDINMLMEIRIDESINDKISRGILLKENDFMEIEKSDLEKLVMSVINFPISIKSSSYINNCVLEMINAYDKQVIKNDQLINGADKISNYLLDNEPEQYLVYTINIFQIKKRKFGLNDEDRTILTDLLQNDNKLGNICIEILLDNFSSAKKIISSLSSDERKAIKRFPIMNLLPKRTAKKN